MPYGEINGVRMFYRIKGKGIPIIFIHPPLLTSANFTYQLEQLSDRFQVIVFDIRGHGKSGHSDAPLTYSLIAEDMKQLMDLLKIKKAFLCGYSTGGGIALEAMLNYPDRFHGGILVSAMSEVSDWWLRTRLAAAITLTAARAKKLMSAAITWGNSDIPQTFHNMYKEANRGSIDHMKQYYYTSLLYNCTRKLKQLHHPQLLIFGDKDKGFKRYARILQQELPNSTLVYLSGVHHQIPTKAPDRMNRLMSAWIMQQLEPEENIEQPWYAIVEQREEAYFME